MARQPDGGWAMLGIAARVGEGVHHQDLQLTVFIGTRPHPQFHFMPGGGGDLRFVPGIHQLGRLAGLPGDKRRVDFRDAGLLGAETTANSRLEDADFGFRDVQCPRQDSPQMEDDLGGGDYHQPSVDILLAPGAEGFHHRLLVGLGVVGLVHLIGTCCIDRVRVAFLDTVARNEVAFVVGTDFTQCLPVLFRVDQHRVVFCGMEVQHRRQYLIIHLDQFDRLEGGFFRFSGDDRDRVADMPYLPVEDQPVIGRRFRVGLTGQREPSFRDVFPGINRFDSRYLFGNRSIDRTNPGMCMRRTEQLDDQAVFRRDIVGIDRLAGCQCLPVLFADTSADEAGRFGGIAHLVSSFPASRALRLAAK